MTQTDDSSGKGKWFSRLAWLSLVLFAIFWSLGPFFFWLFLGLAISFASFALSYSGIKFTLFQGQPKTQSRYQSYGSPAGEAIPADQLRTRKALRLFFIIGGSMLIFFFVIGVFSASDDQSLIQAAEQENAVPAETSEASQYMSKGIDLYNNGQYDSAILYYDRALALNPDDADIHYYKALVYFMKQDYRTSIRLVRNSLRIEPDYDEAWWLVGDDYYSLNQYDSAIASLEKAYANDFRDPGFLQLLAQSYQKKGNDGKATSLYLDVIKQDTANTDVYNELIRLDPEHADDYRKKVAAVKKVNQ